MKPSLAKTNRSLAREWHPTKNAPLTPRDVTYGSNKKIWWTCAEGHEWRASVHARTSRGNGCPYCAGRAVGKDNCLRARNPKLAREWHPTRNALLTPDQVAAGTAKKAWWVCANGHEWEAAIVNRIMGTGCPFCAGRKVTGDNCLLNVNPRLARQWHSAKNSSLTPKDVTAISGKKVWWSCRKGHEWKAAISNRSYGTGCPYCSGRYATRGKCLQTANPKLAGEWHPTRNAGLTPRHVTPYSHEKAWWICRNGHKWKAVIADRSRGRGCSFCSGRRVTDENSLRTVKPKLAGEWHPTRNGSLTPKHVLPHSNKKAWWKCRKGHEWQAVINNRTSLGRGCPYCRHRATKDTCLQTVNPWVAAEWHPGKNGPLTPDDVKATSSKEVAWQCRKGHEVQERIIDRHRRGGCPVCTLKARVPRLFETA